MHGCCRLPKLADGQRGQSLDKILHPVSNFDILYYNTENQHLMDQNDAQIICYKSYKLKIQGKSKGDIERTRQISRLTRKQQQVGW